MELNALKKYREKLLEKSNQLGLLLANVNKDNAQLILYVKDQVTI